MIGLGARTRGACATEPLDPKGTPVLREIDVLVVALVTYHDGQT
jgi:hypothetical protein